MVCVGVVAWPNGLLANEVVVRDGGSLHSRPSLKSAVAITTNRAVPVRLVRRHGRWLEVKTLTSFDECPSHNGGAYTELRMFVQAKDIAKATRRPFTQQFADGSSVYLRERFVVDELAPPVVERAAKKAGVAIIVRRRQAPTRPAANARTTKMTLLTIGGRWVRLPPKTNVHVRERGDRRTLVAVQRPCATLTGWIPNETLESWSPPGYGSGTGQSYCWPKYYVRKGAPLFWPDGGRAGIAPRDLLMGCRGKPAASDRLCTNLDLLEWASPVEYCFAARHRLVVHRPPPPASPDPLQAP